MAVEFQALTLYANNAAATALQARRPNETVSHLAAVRATPSYLNRLPVRSAIAVVHWIDDPADLVPLLFLRARSQTLHQALRDHPLYPQARDLILADNHPWRNSTVAEVAAKAYATDTLAGGDIVDADALLSSWLRTRPAAVRADCYREILLRRPGVLPLAVELDLLLGKVPGLDLDTIPWLDDRPVLEPSRYPQQLVERELARFPHCDAALANFVIRYRLPITSAQRSFDDAAVAMLATSALHATHLYVNAILDPAENIESISALPGSEQAHIVASCGPRSDHLLSELIRAIDAPAVPKRHPLCDMLEHLAVIDETLLPKAIRMCSSRVLAHYLCGLTPNPVDRATIDWVLDGLDTHPDQWVSDLQSVSSHMWGASFATALGTYTASEIVRRSPNPIFLLSHPGPVGRCAARAATEILGVDQHRWEALITLASEWDGSFQALLEACARL